MRYALGIEYNGANYSGWQRQKAERIIGVQQRLEEALSKVANGPIEVTCAGRTDAGVHATGQIVHFDTPAIREPKSWILGANSNMPKDIAVKWATDVPDDFDARYTATARRYRYIIYNNRNRPAILQEGVLHYYNEELDHELMHEAAQALVGEQDFTSFRAALCQSNTPYRNIHHVNIQRFGEYIVVDIQANAFLYHMVRNIVGSLIKVGSGEYPVSWIKELIELKDRTAAAATVKPNGLYLVRVFYPEQWNIPQVPMGPLFLADD